MAKITIKQATLTGTVLLWSACNYGATKLGLKTHEALKTDRNAVAMSYCQGIIPASLPWNAAIVVAYDQHLRQNYATTYLEECDRLKAWIKGQHK